MEVLKTMAFVTLSVIYAYVTFGLYIARSMHNDFELNWLWQVPLMPLYVVIMYIVQGIDEGISYLKHFTK